MNNNLVDASEATVSVFDHGLLYGDGIFEGIRLYDSCVFKLDEHLERLEYSAKAIMLEMPWSRQQIADAVCETCRANDLKDGYIRLVVTRGVGSLGLSIKNCDQPQLIIIADKIQLYPQEFYDNGLKIITVPTRRSNPAALPPAVKSLNYLNNILAKIEAQHLGYHEAIMLNDQGYIAECTGDNVFIVHKGELITPAASSGALKGITRDTALAIAEELGIPWREANMTRYDVWVAEEVFLTGTAAEIVPIVEIDARVIGDGKPGPITAKFLESFHRRVSVEGTML
ncbi:branched-chain-amino-acid transaminase [Opitutales bacterium]|nr:branched-chain-amino-acid transaminase [Opitutales bacterium]MDB2357863.1 branched-chain-amino-acid transaminase [Opitutales bacterium]MDB2507042.1 branched-chain-amino-acid transaminase [Opitutales bacterium]MDB2681614.1 branched-chain-amino-acid transaminase [Opitutales bacterium]